MKKLLCFALFAFALTECKESPKNVDCGFYICFNIKNDTESDLIVETSSQRITQQPLTIKPSKEETIHYLSGLCGEGYIPEDKYSDYSERDEMALDVEISVNGELMPSIIWRRGYWVFANEEYVATYTLTLTDELIKSIKSEEL